MESEIVEPSEEQVEEPSNDEMPSLDPGEPVKSGCSTVDNEFSPLAFLITWMIVFFRKES